MYRFFIYSCFFTTLLACKKDNKTIDKETIFFQEETAKGNNIDKIDYETIFNNNLEYKSTSFDFPVGKPNAKGYYNAQKFTVNDHLGDDWNGLGGGNSDLGDTIYAISNGYVSEVKNYEGGWGNVITIVHSYKNKLYKSLYAHCDTIIAIENKFVKRGEKIATIGNCNGQYYAHLHLEIRDSIDLDIGAGYSKNTNGYLDPTLFIKNN
ncbi:M23 family metallopeptidase [uncultured Lacinutrix sp.]|uniref:M23 family metallopeptidase n=1 Tax=uncultured Lacinutrix sp. TaxID=574032 RepID=UPI00261456D7|nr:M23 family metallopeptidase [uncultured Lacinutrix sp.]